ncbi:MAG: response regulator [Pseudobdellovibrionaceae bacterium]
MAKEISIQEYLRSLRVLVVDDQEEMRTMLRNMLREIGTNQVFESCDGKEAMAFLEAELDLIDVIVCDWNMPKASGVDVLRRLRQSNPDIPFLMVTGRTDKNSVIEARDNGVSAYIAKPFSSAQLEVKLRVLQQKKVGKAS